MLVALIKNTRRVKKNPQSIVIKVAFTFFLKKNMSEENHFSSAIQYWKGIQLSNLQKELDQQGLAIVEKQKDGLVSRKKLAEQTRGIQYKKKIPLFFLQPF